MAALALLSGAVLLKGGSAASPPAGALRRGSGKGAPTAAFLVPRRQLLYRLDRETAAGESDSDLQDALASSPPEVFFRVAEADGRKTYLPVVPSRVAVTRAARVDLAIFGSELEAVTTAMAAARRGQRVALVADAPLGGLCADTGGNLRYLDCQPGTPRTDAELELFRAIGVRGLVAVPTGVDARIGAFLARRYADRIQVFRVGSLSAVRVDLSERLDKVETDSGVRIEAARYLDVDPECRIGELCGVPMTLKTPSLAYGVVFDLENLGRADFSALRSHGRLWPRRIMARLGVSDRRLGAVRGGKRSLQSLSSALEHDFFKVYENSALGYVALAQGFDFYMSCREAAHPSPDLRWLNGRRSMSGFNVSWIGGRANVNSVSYRLDEAVLQHCHTLRGDPRWAPIVRTEAQGLTDYFRYVLGNPRVEARLPSQFFVRRSTASFETSAPYGEEDFSTPPQTRWRMAYPMDFRGLTPRPGYDDDLMAEIASMGGRGMARWDCRPSSLSTSIPNLFLLNKCATTPRFSGGLRIVQNLVNTGQAWVESLPPTPVPHIGQRKP